MAAASARALSVLSVAFPFAPVGRDAVGGAEQVLSALDRALVAAGHRSIVVACRGSEVAGELVPIPAVHESAIDSAAQAAQHAAMRACIGEVVKGYGIDLIHFHGVDFAAYLPPPGPPALATLHLPPEWYPPEALVPARAGMWLNCVSETQHRALLACLRKHRPRAAVTAPVMAGLDPGISVAGAKIRDGRIKSGHDSKITGTCSWVLPPVANGVDVEGLAGGRHPRRGYALVLGRICREKGQHLAMDAARIAGVPLLLAGRLFPYPEHTAYFETEIRPRLGPICRLIRPVGFARKRRLLSSARCVLLPSQAETSSLVAMEAAACGTPVVAFNVGALPEIVEHGRTGFLVGDVAEMADAIGRAGSIDPEQCRRRARERFSLARATAAYLEVYRRLADGGLASEASLAAG